MHAGDAAGPALASPYEVILGHRFAALPLAVQRAHLAPLAAAGSFDVEHGSHWLTPVLMPLMHLPAAGRGQAVRVDVAVDGADLQWTRRIGSSVLRTRQRAEGSALVERQGIGRVVFVLDVEDGALLYSHLSMSIGGIVIPSFLSPRVRARVSAAAQGWHVAVDVTWRGHLLCRYAGVVAAL